MFFSNFFRLKSYSKVLIISGLLGITTPAIAGQGFLVSFEATGSIYGATLLIKNVDYKNWYQGSISEGVQIISPDMYTEHCAAAFTCPQEASGDQTLANDGIYFDLYVNGENAMQICLSYSGPVTQNCGSDDNPKSIYNGWLTGCYIPNGGFTCTILMGQSGDQIGVIFTVAAQN